MNAFKALARPRKITTLVAAIAALTLVQAASAAVAPGDTFTFDIAGFNATSGQGYILGDTYGAVFGTTQTVTDAGYNGQSYTITSWEVVGATTTTDYFTISTPTSFLTTSTVDGLTITALQFDLGDDNSGVGSAGAADPVNFTSAIGSYTATGTAVYDGGHTLTLSPTTTLASDGLSVDAAEGVNSGTSPIDAYGISEFDFSITYANPSIVSSVPEASNLGMLLAGLGLVGVLARRRRA